MYLLHLTVKEYSISNLLNDAPMLTNTDRNMYLVIRNIEISIDYSNQQLNVTTSEDLKYNIDIDYSIVASKTGLNDNDLVEIGSGSYNITEDNDDNDHIKAFMFQHKYNEFIDHLLLILMTKLPSQKKISFVGNSETTPLVSSRLQDLTKNVLIKINSGNFKTETILENSPMLQRDVYIAPKYINIQLNDLTLNTLPSSFDDYNILTSLCIYTTIDKPISGDNSNEINSNTVTIYSNSFDINSNDLKNLDESFNYNIIESIVTNYINSNLNITDSSKYEILSTIEAKVPN